MPSYAKAPLILAVYSGKLVSCNLLRNSVKTSRLITPLKPRQQSRAGFTNRLCRPRASRSKGAASNLWCP